MIRLRAGYDLKETSPLKAVSASSVPTLFIHGEEDRMIPVSMCRELYDAAACEKEIMIVEGAGHAQASVWTLLAVPSIKTERTPYLVEPF